MSDDDKQYSAQQKVSGEQNLAGSVTASGRNSQSTDHRKDPYYADELDVLEALYRIGREKNVEILTPEQKQKLIDSSRLDKKESIDEHKISADEAVQMLWLSLEKSTASLLIKVGYCTQEEWESKDFPTRLALIKLFLFMFFRINVDDLQLGLYDLYDHKV